MKLNGSRRKRTVIRGCHQQELHEACSNIVLALTEKRESQPSNLFPVIKTGV